MEESDVLGCDNRPLLDYWFESFLTVLLWDLLVI